MFEKLKENILLEVIFKYIILLLLFACVVGLFASGVLFLKGEMSENSLNLHIFFGFSLVVLTIIHSYVKKKKLKKLSLEFKNILKHKPVQMDCNTTRFLNALNDVKVGGNFKEIWLRYCRNFKIKRYKGQGSKRDDETNLQKQR